MKLAIVLPGGGALGRFQCGIIKRILELLTKFNQKVDLVCGTSVGGLNTLMIGKYLNNFQGAIDIWNNIKKNSDVYLGMMQFNNFWDYVRMAKQTFIDNKGKSIIDPSPLYHMLDTQFGDTQLKDLLVQIIVTTTDMSTGERLVFDSVKNPLYKCNDLGKCTSAIPIIFPPVAEQVNGLTDWCVDGGLGRNDPVSVAIAEGATHIILIGTSPDAFLRVDITANILGIATRLEDVIMHAFEEDSWDKKEQYEMYHTLAPQTYPLIKFLDIYPTTNTGSCLDFTNVEQLQKGYDFAVMNITDDNFKQFLTFL